jgi:hypothetical protein
LCAPSAVPGAVVPMTTSNDARARYLAAQSRYNTSDKGQRRNLRYEAAHPERKLRWEPARNALHATMPPPPAEPMHQGADLPPEVDPDLCGYRVGGGVCGLEPHGPETTHRPVHVSVRLPGGF